jgi:uncharacterized membrane protein (DUF2068 family)
MSRPLGVTILAVLALIAAIPALIGGLALVGVATFGTEVPVPDTFMYAVGAGTLLYAGLSLVLAYGFWTTRSWAWIAGLAVQAIGIVTAVSQFANGERYLASMIAGLVLPVVIVIYLLQPRVKASFGRA